MYARPGLRHARGAIFAHDASKTNEIPIRGVPVIRRAAREGRLTILGPPVFDPTDPRWDRKYEQNQ